MRPFSATWGEQLQRLIEVPVAMTHASTADAPFAVPANLIRLSVGLETATDLVGDLEQALAAVGSPSRTG